jgi:hypothetical protein
MFLNLATPKKLMRMAQLAQRVPFFQTSSIRIEDAVNRPRKAKPSPNSIH